MIDRRALLRGGAASGLALASPFAFSQAPQAGTLRLVLGVSPGGTLDAVTRQFAEVLARPARRAVVVENVTGASGIVAAQNVLRAPVGSSLLVGFPTLTTLPLVQKNVPFKLQADFVPVAMVARTPLVLVTGPNGPSSVAELIAKARANPGRLNYGCVEATTRFAAQLLRANTGFDYTEVYYKGGAQLINAAAAGEVDFVMTAAFAPAGMAKAGRVKVLGTLSEKRLALYPDVPTFAEQGFGGYIFEPWLGLFASSATPTAAVDELGRHVVEAVRAPGYNGRLAELGGYAAFADRAAFGAILTEEMAALTAVAAKAGIRPE